MTGLHPDSIARSADGMIRNFGRHAAMEADAMVEKFTRAEDGYAAQTWRRIAQAIRARLGGSEAPSGYGPVPGDPLGSAPTK